jgi:hypothetical protein
MQAVVVVRVRGPAASQEVGLIALPVSGLELEKIENSLKNA